MLNDSNDVKFISLDPSKHSIEPLAKCFNYRGALPQVVIDKIVSSYDGNNEKFSKINVCLEDFYTGYETKPLVGPIELTDTFTSLGKKY